MLCAAIAADMELPSRPRSIVTSQITALGWVTVAVINIDFDHLYRCWPSIALHISDRRWTDISMNMPPAIGFPRRGGAASGLDGSIGGCAPVAGDLNNACFVTAWPDGSISRGRLRIKVWAHIRRATIGRRDRIGGTGTLMGVTVAAFVGVIVLSAAHGDRDISGLTGGRRTAGRRGPARG